MILWQADVMHVNLFLQLIHIFHAVVGTYSDIMLSVLMTSERTKAVFLFLFSTTMFLYHGRSHTIKTDNGLAYINKTLQSFCIEWQIKYIIVSLKIFRD